MDKMKTEMPGRHRSPDVMRLVADIEGKIASGELKPGDPLPGVHAVSESYKIAYGTAIRAFKTLKDKGLVDTMPGRGTFVRGREDKALASLAVVMSKPASFSESQNPDLGWVCQRLLGGINSACLERGLSNQLIFLDSLGANWRKTLDSLRSGTGVIFVAPPPPPMAMRLALRGTPFIVIFPKQADELSLEMPRCEAAFRSGLKEGVLKTLRASGRRRPAFLGFLSQGEHESARREGYLDALKELGIEEQAAIRCDEITREAARKAMDAHIDACGASFDFLCATNDSRALGAMDALRKRGIRTPEDVAILGFDDAPGSEEAGLTTVRLPVKELGERAVELFLEAREKGSETPAIEIPCQLIWRKTVDGKAS